MTRDEIVTKLLETVRPDLNAKIDDFERAGGDLDTLTALMDANFVPASVTGDNKQVPPPVLSPAKTLSTLEGTGVSLADSIAAHPDLAKRLHTTGPAWSIIEDVLAARDMGVGDSGAEDAAVNASSDAVMDSFADGAPDVDAGAAEAVVADDGPMMPAEMEGEVKSFDEEKEKEEVVQESKVKVEVEVEEKDEDKAEDEVKDEEKAKAEEKSDNPHGGNHDSDIVGYFTSPDGELHALRRKEGETDDEARERVQADHADWQWIGDKPGD